MEIVPIVSIMRLSLLTFIALSILRIGKFLSTSKYSKGVRGLGGPKQIISELTIRGIPFIHSRFFRMAPAVYTLLVMYHVTFFAILFFYPAHVSFICRALGLSYTSPLQLSPVIWDILTIANMVCIVAITLRGIIGKIRKTVVGYFKTPFDFLNYAILILIPLTGYMAAHNASEIFLNIHIVLSCIYIAFLPYTPVFHAILGFIARGIKGWRLGW